MLQVIDGVATCPACGFQAQGAKVLEATALAMQCPQCRLTDVKIGTPGTELAAIFKSLGLEEKVSCGCQLRAATMDAWGVAGCRKNLDTIVGWLKAGKSAWPFKDQWKAKAMAVATGLAFKINWLDPFPGLVELAIKRAEEKQQHADE